MGLPLCGGNFHNTFYRFDNDAKIYQYNSSTSIAKISPSFISQGTDSVTSIKKCIYNGANAIYLIGATDEDPEMILYSAVFNSTSHGFNFRKLPDPTNGSLDSDSTIILPVDRWSGLSGCIMVGYGTNSLGVSCPQKASIKVFSNLNSSIISLSNLFTTYDSHLYQLTAEGLKGFTVSIGDKLSSISILNSPSSVYKFQEHNIIDSNTTWKIITSEDSQQALFYNSGPSFQLLKLDNETFTGKLVANTFHDINSDSVALFQNSSLVVLNKSAYQMVSIDQVLPTTGINNTAPASAPTSLESVVSKKIDPAVAGGFTALGIAIGVLLTALILYILSQCRRERNISSPRGNTSIDSGTHIKEVIPSASKTMKFIDIPPVYASNVTRRPSYKAQLIPTNIGEGNPKNTRYSSLFNNRCQLKTGVTGEASTNPHHQSSIYVRECTFQDKPALIHYFTSKEGGRKFENAMQTLNSPLLNQNVGHVVRFFDAIQLKKTTSADSGFAYILITSYYEPKQSLAALYQSTGEPIVDISDETFVVYTIYSLLLAVRDLHAAGYVHRGLCANSFYAESNAPTTDWVLADFDEAGLTSAAYSVPPSKCEYYDALYNGKTYEFVSDIWALGILLFKVISGGQDVNMGTNTDYSDRIEHQIRGKVYSEQYRILLNSTLCNGPYKTRLTAQELVEFWESRFDFGQT